jgi:hypothetical protein
MYSHVR